MGIIMLGHKFDEMCHEGFVRGVSCGAAVQYILSSCYGHRSELLWPETQLTVLSH